MERFILEWWPVFVTIAGGLIAWGTQRADSRALDRRVCTLETELKETRLTNVAIAGALARLNSIDDRLDRIENRMDRRDNAEAK